MIGRVVVGVVLVMVVSKPLQAEGVPPEALKQAELATKLLGDQVLQMNFSYTIQKMYPRWKKRAAMKYGGEDKLAEELAKLPEQMKMDGITILSFTVGAAESGFPVPEYGEWLVFVPTSKTYLVPEVQTGKNRRFESAGYQIAVAKAGGADWTFIDGSNLTVRELRSLFPSLPEEEKKLNLPRVEVKEIK